MGGCVKEMAKKARRLCLAALLVPSFACSRPAKTTDYDFLIGATRVGQKIVTLKGGTKASAAFYVVQQPYEKSVAAVRKECSADDGWQKRELTTIAAYQRDDIYIVVTKGKVGDSFKELPGTHDNWSTIVVRKLL